MLRRAHRLAVSWIALVAVLMASLAPALSHATGRSDFANWTQVCTAAGTAPVAAGDGTVPHDPAALHGLEHCPYCGLHVDAFPVPSAPPTVHAPMPLGDIVPAAFLHADETLGVWRSAQPRAPPLLG